jgi:hypothetical protein
MRRNASQHGSHLSLQLFHRRCEAILLCSAELRTRAKAVKLPPGLSTFVQLFQLIL